MIEKVEKEARKHYSECLEFYEVKGISFSEFLEAVAYYIRIGISSIDEACEAADYDYM